MSELVLQYSSSFFPQYFLNLMWIQVSSPNHDLILANVINLHYTYQVKKVKW